MPRYLLAYHGGSMPETETEKAHVMQAWTNWYTELGEVVVDPGNPVGKASTVTAEGKVTSGGGANPVSGYTIIEADSLDEAVKLAMGCPARSGGTSIEVAETFNVM